MSLKSDLVASPCVRHAWHNEAATLPGISAEFPYDRTFSNHPAHCHREAFSAR